MGGNLIPDRRLRTAVVALVFASVLGVAMLVGRAIIVERIELNFYVWNLTLAWLPLLFALRVYRLAGLRPARWWMLALCAVLWFLFFPNAPYIVTDFLHLHSKLAAPLWFDIVLMMSFAWIGLLLGYLSLMLMQEIVRARGGVQWSWVFAISMLGLGSIGIYLGRFARLNSWDVLVRPTRVAGDALSRFDIHSNPEALHFLLTFFCFSVLSYTTLHALAHLHHLPAVDAGSTPSPVVKEKCPTDPAGEPRLSPGPIGPDT